MMVYPVQTRNRVDRDHILCCSHPSRQKWWHKLFTAIRKADGEAQQLRPALVVALLINSLDKLIMVPKSTTRPSPLARMEYFIS
jgi:hypothetical protein